MKTKYASLTLVALIGIVGTTSALAENNYGERFRLSDQTNATQNQQSTPLGHAVSSGTTRVVNIDSETKYLNVQRHETVQINANGKSLIWNFDTLGTPVFQLSKIFPGVDGVTVYVAKNVNRL